MSILTRSTTSRATRCGCALTASTPRATTRSSCVTSPRTTLFRKPLRVGGLRDDEKSPHEERRRECFDVSFFPEGGYLVNGYSCRVGFRALGDDGRPRFSEGGAARRQGPLHRLPAHTPCGYRQRGVPAPCRTALHGRVPRPEGTSAPLRTPRCQGLYLRAARRPHRLDLHSLHPFGTQLAAARTAARGAPLRHAVLQQGVGSAGANAHLPPRGAARGAVSSAAPRRSDGQGPLRAAGLQPRRRSPPPASRDDGAR